MNFQQLSDNYYQAWFRFHPEQAVAVGESGYASMLRPYADDDIGALISLNKSLLCSLQELDVKQLSANEKLDFNILFSAASEELHELLENDWRFVQPEKYLPVNAIYQLLNKPVENFHQAFEARLDAIPAYLRGAKSYLKQKPEKIPSLWLASAIEQAKEGVGFLLNLEHHVVIKQKFDNPRRVTPLCQTASVALGEFVQFLEKEIKPFAAGDFAIGEETFNRLLKHKHFLDIDAKQLCAFGEALFEKTKKDLVEVLNGQSLAEALVKIKKSSPTKNELLETYRQSMKNALSFISDNNLISVPASQQLSVIETPAFLCHEIPFAAYEEPTRHDTNQQGYYYVTVPSTDEGLEEHNHISIDLTSVHEAYPGHHLQFSTANLSSLSNSLTRVINATATFYEGWALYCEQLMVDQGYLSSNKHKIIMLRDRLWRALRIKIDVGIQTQGVSVQQAASWLIDELGFTEEQAMAELNWYSQSPTVPMSYATGWAIISAMRHVLEQTPGFNLKQFHDDLLAEGSVALPLVLQSQFGQQAWELAFNAVFARDIV